MACPFCDRSPEEWIDTENHFWSVCEEHGTRWTLPGCDLDLGRFTSEDKDHYERNWERLEAHARVCGHCTAAPEPPQELPSHVDCPDCGSSLCPLCRCPMNRIERPMTAEPKCPKQKIPKIEGKIDDRSLAPRTYSDEELEEMREGYRISWEVISRLQEARDQYANFPQRFKTCSGGAAFRRYLDAVLSDAYKTEQTCEIMLTEAADEEVRRAVREGKVPEEVLREVEEATEGLDFTVGPVENGQPIRVTPDRSTTARFKEAWGKLYDAVPGWREKFGSPDQI